MGQAQEGLAVIIPARLASTRLPRKLLALAAGRPILEWTWRRACLACGPDAVWIATDSDEIASAAASFGARVVPTGEHRCGTERVAEAATRLSPTPEWVINLQGDEPLVELGTLRALARALSCDPGSIATCGAPLESPAAWLDPAVVKVVDAADGRILYFSRAPVPGTREGGGAEAFVRVSRRVRRHIGIYGFPRALLARFVTLAPAPLEEAESLEQMRAIEAGLPMRLVRVAAAPPAVDTPADLEAVRRILASADGAGGDGDG
ncbi:MAG: 3-deoxy-manno-octulosonate cytidylyltransferase [Candidatus Eisenbacteria bacterium]|uniref:3-deoxy-manno-octulosonate cytidylyltransferase n=1 Tax=Eiseniibacteriota bacterium TaxID=2212470 RepID=A0A938BRC2_UNCEI|nr:3-deoxy-manno-octulosonate cytidylyltransferase [Candidatus Eisenbacteria bacterium]